MHLRPARLTSLACALAAYATLLPAAPQSTPKRLAHDFNSANSWPAARAVSTASLPASALPSALSWAPVGSFDTAGSTAQSPALLLTADATGLGPAWRASLRSGPLAVATGETELGKLTLAFDLSATSALPVLVTVTSLDAQGRPTGALEGRVFPAAPDFIHRHALDLDKLKPSGPGKFSPRDPAIELTFTLDGAAWPAAKHELRLDNVSFAGPAFYVSPRGSDTADGRTEATALATPQRALDLAQPGDIVLLGEGTYRGPADPSVTNGGFAPAASFPRPGTPAAWIVLKNHPGQTPVLASNGWNIIDGKYGTKEARDSTHTLAYLEVRGLHVRGDNQTIRERFPDALGQVDSRTNTNGITINGYYMDNTPHHIRIADNLVEYTPGGGINTLETDWVFIENNTTRYTSWHTIYGTSGISTLGAASFDASVNVTKILIRNNASYGNETYVRCIPARSMTDGNGIIIDVNQNSANRPNDRYTGRTLVVGNLCVDNGGAGIHTVRAHHVDILHNTAYLNSASEHLQYGQITATWKSNDVLIAHNLLVAPVANLAARQKPEAINPDFGGPNEVTYRDNLYFGGNDAPRMFSGDRVADPLFVNPSRNPLLGDFRLRPESPALVPGRRPAGAFPRPEEN